MVRKYKDTLTEINTGGGELFLDTEFLEEILKIDFKNKITLLIITNGMVMDFDLLKRLNDKFNLRLLVSLDAVTEINDYVRINSKYKKVLENIEKMLEIVDAIDLHPTITIFNVFEMKKLYDLFEKKFGKKVLICLNGLIAPEQYSISTLPDNLKKEALEVLESYKEFEELEVFNIEHIKGILERKRKHRKEFLINDLKTKDEAAGVELTREIIDERIYNFIYY
jgi:sulfatase maturation enzyme AslB (radical SAM superfamily)